MLSSNQRHARMKEPSYDKKERSSWLLQLSVLSALTLQNTALVLFMKLSESRSYIASTVVVASECVKFALSCYVVAKFEGQEALTMAFVEVPENAARLALPSLLYVIQNNLLFEGVRLLSPTIYMACSQSKILTSAFFGALMLKSRITYRQVLALCLLICGMILVQSKPKTVTVASIRTSGSAVDTSISLKGVFIVLLASTTSGFAGAYLEKMYKDAGQSNAKRSIWFRNAQLACLSVPIALCSAYWQDSERLKIEGPFQGCSILVATIIALQAIGGLVVAAVMRYASNMLKCFAVSASICSCAIATRFLFNDVEELEVHQIIGIMIVLCSTFMYAMKTEA